MTPGRPSIDTWLEEIKSGGETAGVGMFLAHNGIVRASSRDGRAVTGMELAVDRERLAQIVETARLMEGIAHVRVWVNEGTLDVGDDIMYVFVGGDVRENVFGALQALVTMIKTEVVAETERYE
ncbi:MAG: molybdenum cofactor biosynthesis protein MoaE [Anaerosomatales bacterium]|nr:molybdenum cofactor biosynthesis protein MoaE [Anaerosomatales bacterium]